MTDKTAKDCICEFELPESERNCKECAAEDWCNKILKSLRKLIDEGRGEIKDIPSNEAYIRGRKNEYSYTTKILDKLGIK